MAFKKYAYFSFIIQSFHEYSQIIPARKKLPIFLLRHIRLSLREQRRLHQTNFQSNHK